MNLGIFYLWFSFNKKSKIKSQDSESKKNKLKQTDLDQINYRKNKKLYGKY